ncbi:hypothetical protein PCYB_006960, partial [Plasmodium cynomolgi strain B]
MEGGNNATNKGAEGTKKEVVISDNVLQLSECKEEEHPDEGDPFNSSRHRKKDRWKRDDADYGRRGSRKF